jgi:hypothetical protein
MVALRGRVAKLERTFGRAGPEHWRPILAAELAHPQFDEQRARITAALCSRHPWCTFAKLHDRFYEGDTALYLLSWANRDTAPHSRPYVRVYVRRCQPEPSELATEPGPPAS